MVEMLEGVCSQYECVDDATCRHATGVAEATCVVPGWNCLCPFSYSLKSNMEGYDTYHDVDGKGSGGRCMGILFFLSVRGSTASASAMKAGWLPFLVAAILLLPFGQRRVTCTHHESSVHNMLLRATCHVCAEGRCVDNPSWEDDYAWSLKCVECCLWYHLAILSVWMSCLGTWCVAVALLAIAIMIVACIVGCVLGALGLGDGGGGGDCKCCEGDCKCCEGCEGCDGCCSASVPFGGNGDVLIFYTGGPSGGGDCGACCAGCGDDGCCCARGGGPRCGLCFLFLYVLSMLPRLPQNMLGGALGRCCLGTHLLSRSEAGAAGGHFNGVFSLNWMRGGESTYGNSDWRARVRSYLRNEDASRVGAPSQQTMRDSDGRNDGNRTPFLGARSPGDYRATIRGVPVSSSLDRPFEIAQDACVPNTFADYRTATCWICCEESIKGFHLYTCGHIFCAMCSVKMLERGMPCPLCRRKPLHVRVTECAP